MKGKDARIVTIARSVVKTVAGCAGMISSWVKSLNWELVLHMGSTWIGKKKEIMKRIPVIDIGECTECESCLEICPDIFIRNRETGLIEVADLPEYPEQDVMEAISLCPADCISWEEF